MSVERIQQNPLQMVCLGVNYRTAPVEVRERFSVAKRHLEEVNARLCALTSVQECVLLSTCNRTEVYFWTEEPELARQSILAAFLPAGQQGAPSCFYRHEGREALRHLAHVAAGLDSMVIGETEIFGQLKDAYRAAQAAQTTGYYANRTLQHVFSIAKKVRSSTRITSGPTSVGAAAVSLAGQALGDLSGASVLIVGAGEIARSTAQSLSSRGAQSIFVANRSYDRAVELAGQIGGSVIRFSEWLPYLEKIDIVIVSTASPVYVVSPAALQAACAQRGERPLFLIDLSVPRNVDPACAAVPGVRLYDIDAMESMADRTLQARASELVLAEKIVQDWVDESHQLLLPALTL